MLERMENISSWSSLSPTGKRFTESDAASWPPLPRDEQVGELAAALEEGIFMDLRDDEN